ncbi:acyltransferase [Paraprevotella clara]|jgi:surface polysaccharide O-acyltransferase-like enzyme|uniref:acyltransferase n=1 Tax=Paraprevotella clara TaxID=454154 RepID=UPI003A9569B7
METKRIVFLDYLRAIACFMVILVHVCEAFYFNLDGISFSCNADRWWISFIDSSLRPCVPLFIMASAYLLVPLKDSTPVFFKRRFTRVCIPFVVWGLLYAFLPLLWGGHGWDGAKTHLLTFLYNFPSNAIHLWFVYMLIGVYFFMPILSPWLKQVGRKEELFFLGLWFLTTFWHYVKLCVPGGEIYGECSWNDFHILYYNAGYIGFLLMAHYVRTYIDWSLRKTLAVAVPVFLIGYAFSVGAFYHLSSVSSDPFVVEQPWRFCTPNVAMMTFALFIVFKKINWGSGWLYRGIFSISKLSYGMYLAHYMVLNLVYPHVAPHFNTPGTILVAGIVIYAICYVLTKLLSYLPKSKYIVG